MHIMLLGVVCVVLVTKGKVSNFFWGAINSLLYGLFAYAYGYAGDAQLNLFYYLPLQVAKLRVLLYYFCCFIPYWK